MAIGYQSFAQNSALGGTSVSMNHTLVKNTGTYRMVIMTILYDYITFGLPTAVTFNGVAMTYLGNRLIGSLRGFQYYILDADLPGAGGPYAVNVTFAAAFNSCWICTTELDGCTQGAPTFFQTAGTGTSANTRGHVGGAIVGANVIISVTNTGYGAEPALGSNSAIAQRQFVNPSTTLAYSWTGSNSYVLVGALPTAQAGYPPVVTFTPQVMMF